MGQARKHYVVPKDLLCYYSTYFDRCFNGHSLEATDSKLTLPEDDVFDFEILLEYVFGHVSSCIEVEKYDEAAMKICIDFIQYSETYGLLGASTAVSSLFHKVLRLNPVTILKIEDIEVVFRVFEEGNQFRVNIAKALSNGVLEGHLEFF